LNGRNRMCEKKLGDKIYRSQPFEILKRWEDSIEADFRNIGCNVKWT
jgi:hypothetical protein